MTLWCAPTWTGRLVVRLINAIAPASQQVVAWATRRSGRITVRLVVAFLVAGTLLTPLDALQVRAGVITAGTLPSLAFLRFGILGVVLAAISAEVDPTPHPMGVRGIVEDVALFALGYAVTTLHLGSVATCAFLGAILLTLALLARMRHIPWWELVPFVVVLGGGGTCLESIGAALGFYQYADRALDGVPLWLPLLWGSGAFAARDLFAGRTP